MNVAVLNGAGAIPKPIVDKLTRLIRRVRWLIVVRGACATAATGIGALLAVMAIDASVTLFSLSTRWALTLSAYGATVAVALWLLVRPLGHSFTLTGIARAIEAHHPELQERISSAVELLTSRDAPELRGSEQLIGALVEQATDNVRGIQPRREVTLRAAMPFLVAAGVVSAILAGIFIAWPKEASFLFRRATAPFLNLPNLRALDLEVEPGNRRVLEGDRLDVKVLVSKRAVRSARLRVVQADGSEMVSEMAPCLSTADPRPAFVLSYPAVAQGFRYRIHAGDALTQYYTIAVEKRPAIEQLEVRYEFPKYAGREPVTESPANGNIRAIAGTTVKVTARTNKPMKAAELVLNGRPAAGVKPSVIAEGDAPAVAFSLKLASDRCGQWVLQLTDLYGFASYSPEHTIDLAPDTAPSVAVIEPKTKALRLPPTARVPIGYTLEDDIGLGGADLLIEVDGRGQPSRPVALPAAKGPLRAVKGETGLSLGTLNLRNAKYVTFQFRATDNCPKEFGGPHHGVSDLYRIELDVHAPSFAAAQLMDQERKLKESLEKVKRDLQSAKHDSQRLREELPKKEASEKDNKRAEEMRKKLAAAESTARNVAQEMQGGYFGQLAERVKELADDHIAKAENVAGQIPAAKEPANRGILAKEADQLIDRSLKMVDELLKEIEPVSDVVRKAIELDELAKREADLTREKLALEQAKADQAAMTPEEWQKAQQALAKELGEMLKDTPGAPQAALKLDQQAAADFAKDARQMAQQQAALAQQNPQLAKVQQIDKALGDLARQQQALANEAAAGAASQPQAQPMNQAAENIQAGKLPQAVQNQAAVENALNQAAQQMAQGQQGGNQGQQAPQPAGQQGGEQGQQGQQPAAQQAAPQNAAQVAGLAKRQGELREQTQQLLNERQQLVAQQQQGQADRLLAEQQGAARQAAELAQNVGNVAPQPDQIQNQAANAAAQAAEALQGNQIAQAAQAANQAGNQLGQLANRLEAAAAQPFAGQQAGQRGQQGGQQGAQQGQQPGQQGQQAGDQAQQAGNQGQQGGQQAGDQGQQAGQQAGQQGGQQGGAQGQQAGQQGGQQGGQQPGQQGGQQGGQRGGQQAAQQAQLAQQASDLAERQQQLAREMQALAAGNPLQAAAAQQAALADRAGDLAQTAAALQQQAQQLGAGQAQAAQAAGQLAQAQQQAGQAAGQLTQAAGQQGQGAPQGQAGQGQPGQGAPSPSAAAPSQQAAAQALNAAAQALDSLGQALGQSAAESLSGAPGQVPGPGQMAQAYQSASQAGQTGSAMSAAQAAGQMGQMAGQAASQAMAAGGNLVNQPHPKGGGNPTMGTGAQSTDLSESKLRELGIKLEDWARLPGELRDQILQAASDLGPEEYRPLIKRYFQEIAKRGGAKKPQGK